YTGQSWEESQGLGWLHAIHPEDAEQVRRDLAAACRQPRTFVSTGRLWHAESRTYRYFESRAVPLFNEDGTVREWVGRCLDVEEQRKKEASLIATKSQLELVTEVIAAQVAHCRRDL